MAKKKKRTGKKYVPPEPRVLPGEGAPPRDRSFPGGDLHSAAPRAERMFRHRSR